MEAKPFDPQGEEEEETYLMHISKTIESEKLYKEWVRSMEQIEDSETKEVLFLPVKHAFEPVGLCGSGGLVRVPLPSCSLPSTTTSSSSRRRSKTGPS